MQWALQSRNNTLWEMAGWAMDREDGWERRGFAEPVQFAHPPPSPRLYSGRRWPMNVTIYDMYTSKIVHLGSDRAHDVPLVL